MGVYIEPTIAQQLGPEAVSAIANIFDPNKAFRDSMQRAVGANPALAQQLSDLEANAPGTLQRLGFGPLGDAIKQIPESIPAQLEQDNRTQLLRTGMQKAQLDESQTGLDLQRVNDTLTALKQNPKLRGDAVYKMLTGQTMDQSKITAADASVAPAKAAAEIAVSKQTQQQAEAGTKQFAEVGGLDFHKLAQDFINGNLDGGTAANLFITPGASDSFRAALQEIEQEKQRALMAYLGSFRGENTKDNLEVQKAFQRYSTTNAGTLDAWQQYLFHGGQQQVNDLRKMDPSKLTQDQKNLIAVADADERQQTALRLKQNSDANNSIASAITNLRTSVAKGDGESTQQLLLKNLQDAIDAKFAPLGQHITVHYGKRPDVGSSDYSFWTTWGQGQGLYYTDEKGNRIDDSRVFADTGASQDTKVLQYAAYIQGLTGQARTDALENLKATDPQAYDAVTNFLAHPSK